MLLMSILNVTPDSFSDGGAHATPETAAAAALQMERDGADIIDVGGESTRPGSEPVDEGEELRRVVPAVRAMFAAGLKTPVSIDTRRASVAEACIRLGASIINDVSALESDPRMARVVRDGGARCVLMHGYGTDEGTCTPQKVAQYLRERAIFAMGAGIERDRIILDPGFGFGKNVKENLDLLEHLDEIVALGFPVLVGLSRKRFVGAVSGIANPLDRDAASARLAAVAVEKGASIIRTHNVTVGVKRLSD